MKKKRGRKKKVTPRDRLLKFIKVVCLICLIVLFVEVVYIVSKNKLSNNKNNYFDGINDFQYRDDYFIAVGSNNDNDKKIEKAKVVRYSLRKEKSWEYIYNKGYNSTFLAVDIDKDNNIIAVGSYESNDDSSDRTAVLVKYDSTGKVLFEKKFSLLDNSKFTSIKVFSDGYLVTGQSIYNDMAVGDSKGGAILLKYDKEGNLIWKTNYGSSKSASYNNLAVYDDNIYVVGKKDDSVGVVSKYSMDGKLITSTLYKNIDDIGFTGITVNSDNIIVSGAKKVSNNNINALLVKYDSGCDFVSEVLYDSGKNERYNKIINDKDKNLVVVGTIFSKSKHDEFTYEGVIGKYKSNFKKIDIINYGDNSDDYFTQVRLVDGNYLVSGYSSYKDDGYLSKFITYSDALKILEVK
ncbi:MAG: hypothetical protein E7160_03350 [Firmicutes bacterium]|nr:hypothetical protein [Bacillota bacterium]